MTAKRRTTGKLAATALVLLLALSFSAQATAEKVITLTFAGDCVIGSEERNHALPESFDSAAEKNGYDYFFANFQDLFAADDCTVVNLLGVLADTNDGAMKSRPARFRGAEEYVKILQAGSVEAVSLSNNHTRDYSQRGLENTQHVLTEAGIGWTSERDFWIFEKDGIRIAFVSIDYGAYQRSRDKIRSALQTLRDSGEINATVYLIHEGREYLPTHQRRQEEFGAYAVQQAGADLVIMHQAHVLQGIRILENRGIFYSLGNFVYGGDTTVRKEKNADTNLTMVVQARLYFTEDGACKGRQITLYPAWSSGTDPENNYQPCRMTAKEAGAVLAAVQADTDFQLPEIRTDEKGFAYVKLDFQEEASKAYYPEDGPEPPAPQPGRDSR